MTELERQLIVRVYQIIKDNSNIDFNLEVFEVQYWNKYDGSINTILDKIEAEYTIDKVYVGFDLIELMFVSNARASLAYSTCKRGVNEIYPKDMEARNV